MPELDERLIRLEERIEYLQRLHDERHSRESIWNSLGIAFAIALGIAGVVLAALACVEIF